MNYFGQKSIAFYPDLFTVIPISEKNLICVDVCILLPLDNTYGVRVLQVVFGCSFYCAKLCCYFKHHSKIELFDIKHEI